MGAGGTFCFTGQVLPGLLLGAAGGRGYSTRWETMNKLVKLARILQRGPFRRALLGHRVAAGVDNLTFLALHHYATIFDVGANRGQFYLAARHVMPDARIYSFEPLAPAYDRFRRVMAKDEKTTIFKLGLGAEKGELPISIPDQDDCSSLALDLPGARKGIVSIDTLDNLFSDVAFAQPALLKVDVQGFEMDVLKGAEKTLARLDDLYVEVTFRKCGPRAHPAHEVITWLKQRGFVIWGVYNPMSHGEVYHGCDLHFRREGVSDSV
jgi:FkbM family methyltransferase